MVGVAAVASSELQASDPAGSLAVVDPMAKIFCTGIIALTLAPLIFFGLLAGPLQGQPATISLAGAVWIIGIAHVGTTGALWFDRRYRQHMSTRPIYFYVGPLALMVACVADVEAFGRPGFLAFNACYTAWLLYHFGRQNWGVLCLIATAVKAGRPTEAERIICRWAPAGGIIGAVIAANATGSFAALLDLGLIICVVVAAASLAISVRQWLSGGHPLKAIMTAVAGVFFLPVYFFGSYGLVAIGVAHAYQYELVMVCMSQSRRPRPARFSWLPLLLVTIIYTASVLVMTCMNWGEASRPLKVLALAIIIWHFIIDADVWRLSRPFQRQAVRDSLPFLFR